MAEWGQYYWGFHFVQDPNAYVEAGKVYQSRLRATIPVPENIELAIIKEMWKYRQHGAEPTYIYVKGGTVIVQWYQRTASPVTAAAIILGMMALALLIAVIGLVLVDITKVEGIPATLGLSSSTIIIIAGIIILILVFVFMLLPAIRKKPEEKKVTA